MQALEQVYGTKRTQEGYKGNYWENTLMCIFLEKDFSERIVWTFYLTFQNSTCPEG
jgi:hypothetical protein